MKIQVQIVENTTAAALETAVNAMVDTLLAADIGLVIKEIKYSTFINAAGADSYSAILVYTYTG